MGDYCGENRWEPVNAVLEFTIQGGLNQDGTPLCSIEVKTLPSIQLGLRLEMTLDDFYSNNGELTFIEKLAMQLNISRDRIKIVGIRAGSVVLNVVIESDPNLINDTDQGTELEGISITIQHQVNNGTLDVGAPLLDFEMSVSQTSTAQTADSPVVIMPEPASTEKQSLLWPITIMVASASILIAAVLLLVVILKKMKQRNGGGQKKAVITDEMFKKVWPEQSVDSINMSRLPPGSSERELKQRPTMDATMLDQIQRGSFKSKVEEI